MTITFYVAAVIAVVATAMVISGANAIHALLNLVVSLLAVAIVFYVEGAPFAAALQVIVYAGAIMVLFVFIVMMINLGKDAAEQERGWLAPRVWVMPGLLSAVLLGELVYMLWWGEGALGSNVVVSPRQVGTLFFGPYLLAVELASLLLLAGLVGAYHLGREESQAAEPSVEQARAERETRMAAE